MGEKVVAMRIYTDKNPQEAMGRGSKGGRDATNAPPRRPRRDAINRDAAVIERDAGLGRDAARHVATKTVGSDIDGRILGLVWDAYGEAVGGGIFALRRPRPYRRHGGEEVARYATPTIICAHGRINGNGEWEDNAASLEKP